MSPILPILFIVLFFSAMIDIYSSWISLVKYFSSQYPEIFKKHIAQNGFIVDTISPNIFLLGKDAGKIASKDVEFGRLRLRYGIAWALFFLWFVGGLGFMALITVIKNYA